MKENDTGSGGLINKQKRDLRGGKMNHRGKSQREKGVLLNRGSTWAKVVAHILEQKQSDRVKFCGIMNETYRSLGVFLVSAKNAFVPVKHNNSVNTYSIISTVPQGSERCE